MGGKYFIYEISWRGPQRKRKINNTQENGAVIWDTSDRSCMIRVGWPFMYGWVLTTEKKKDLNTDIRVDCECWWNSPPLFCSVWCFQCCAETEFLPENLFIYLFVFFILESVNNHNSDKHLKLLVNLTHLPRQSQLLNKMPVKHTNFFSKYKPVQALKDIFLFNGLSLEWLNFDPSVKRK